MGGRIDAYIDIVSPYSWFAFKYLRQNRELLRSHGVEVEFHSFFLGGANDITGNKPPWTLPIKAAYGAFDRQRASAHFGVKYIDPPPFFPILSVLPNRALIAIKKSSDPKIAELQEAAIEACFAALWAEPVLDISRPENMARVLAGVFRGAGLLVQDAEELAHGIVRDAQRSEEVKAELRANTRAVVDMGGFGSPWMWVRNETRGVEEGFFGSDRFHFMWDFLGLPVRHLEIVPKIEGKTRDGGPKI